MPLDPLETLRKLIAIASVNPMGGRDDGPEFYENRLTDHLQSVFTRLGLAWQRQRVHEGRDNIVARLDGSRSIRDGGGLLLFEVHQDTVPVTGMTIEPFTPTVRDGRVYGRGACDVKGGMAAMLTAMSRLAAERPADMPTVLLACCVNEEHGFTGAAALADLWSDTPDGAKGTMDDVRRLVQRRPDAAIVAEPTALRVVVAHKGTVRWRCHALGRAAHSSQPELGDNAIYRMMRVINAIEQYQDHVSSHQTAHALCGRPTVSVTTIRGGLSVNTIPDRATIEIDRRLAPDEDPQTAWRDLVEYVADVIGTTEGIEHELPYLASGGLVDGSNGKLSRRLLKVAQTFDASSEVVGVPYGTDAAVIAASGVPTVVFGPGSIDQAHTADEWIEIEQLTAAADLYYQAALQLLDN
jgi:acetylornithine deacetylase/succinyl-diaminopimelate desuccinylase-like protein